MEWINLRILWPRIIILKQYLPLKIFSQIESVVRKPKPTRNQMNKITRLGDSIGLQKNEIIAAIDTPLAEPGFTGKSRFSLYISIIVITIIVAFGILLTWYVVDPDSFPIPTYVPGSLYGSIRPQDFWCHNYTALMA